MSFPRRRSVSENSRRVAILMGAGRVAFGAVMVVAPRVFLAAARTPSDQMSDSARLLTRMTGLRDVLLGIHVLSHLDDSNALRSAALLNAAADAGDAASLAISTRWEGFFTAGASGFPVAAGASAAFVGLARSLD
jgi:hypothetical protein